MKISEAAIQKSLDLKTKPPRSLGQLEAFAAQLAQIQNTLKPCVDRQRVCVFAASHGVSEEGVSAYPAAVTAQMILNFLAGGAAISVICRTAGIDLQVIDVGVDDSASPLPIDHLGLRRSAITSMGTRSFIHGAAMSLECCEAALRCGMEEVRRAVEDGIELLGIGEMGIGNTTSASALCFALTDISLQQLVGRGTGVSDEILELKREVIRQGCELHSRANSPMEWLSAVGGYEIAAMVGAVMECHVRKLPLVIDGFIATSAVLVAHAMEPAVLETCFFSHCSAESGHSLILEHLKVSPILDFGMRLGEGSGAALVMPLLRIAAHLMSDMATFEEAGVSQESI